jgi:hypothetical protein
MTRFVVIIGFLVAFAAGWVIGIEMRSSSLASSTPTTRPSRGSWLAAELKLSPQQTEELNKIWSETARRGRGEQDDRRRQFRKERDDAIGALIKPEDKEKFELIQKNFTDELATMDREMKESFAAAVEKTKAVLTPEQRTKYEELLARRESERNQRDHNRRGEEHATTQPRSQS